MSGKWFEDFFGITKLKKEISDLKYERDRYRTESRALKVAIEKLEQQKIELTKSLKKKQKTINKLQYALGVSGHQIETSPSWLSDKTRAYQPYLEIPGKRRPEPIEPTDIYSNSPMLKRIIELGETGQRYYERIMFAWKTTIDSIVYAYDRGDSWQQHTTTLTRKKGDCEDGSVLFLDLCGGLGIPSDKIFNAVGQTEFGYHSYPIVYFDEEDSRDTDLKSERWYIFETTIDYQPPKPLGLIGSKYWVDSLANWQHQGIPAEEYLEEKMNGKKTGEKKDARIENSKLKVKKISDYWKQTIGFERPKNPVL